MIFFLCNIGFWMIKIRRNCKEIERKSFGAKTGQKQGKNRGKTGVCEISQPLRNQHFVAKPFRSPNKFAAESPLRCEIAILLRNHFWHTSAISQHSEPHFAAVKRLRNPKA